MTRMRRVHWDLTEEIIGSAVEVHRSLGPGLLESAYEVCLAWELELRGLSHNKQVAIPLEYKGVQLECGYRADFVIDDRILVELKAVERVSPIHEAQLMTYLRLLSLPVGLLINFHNPVLKDGITRRVL